MRYNRIIFRVHALKRMFERGIDEEEVREVLENGDVIEQKPDDVPYPSYLMLGLPGGRPIHVAASDDPQEQATIVITVYDPDPRHWDSSFRRRRK
jgi:hypothetical protein